LWDFSATRTRHATISDTMTVGRVGEEGEGADGDGTEDQGNTEAGGVVTTVKSAIMPSSSGSSSSPPVRVVRTVRRVHRRKSIPASMTS
jgi:hypothetical protein